MKERSYSFEIAIKACLCWIIELKLRKVNREDEKIHIDQTSNLKIFLSRRTAIRDSSTANRSMRTSYTHTALRHFKIEQKRGLPRGEAF